MRRCGTCGETKPTSEFNWRSKAKGLYDAMCRPCRAAYKHAHYRANRQRYIANARKRRVALNEDNMRRVIELLRATSCVDCGEDDVLVLEFDHQRDKAFTISTAIPDKAWPEIEREIAKCEVVCANCHRRRTAVQRGYLRASLADPGNFLGHTNPTGPDDSAPPSRR